MSLVLQRSSRPTFIVIYKKVEIERWAISTCRYHPRNVFVIQYKLTRVPYQYVKVVFLFYIRPTEIRMIKHC